MGIAYAPVQNSQGSSAGQGQSMIATIEQLNVASGLAPTTGLTAAQQAAANVPIVPNSALPPGEIAALETTPTTITSANVIAQYSQPQTPGPAIPTDAAVITRDAGGVPVPNTATTGPSAGLTTTNTSGATVPTPAQLPITPYAPAAFGGNAAAPTIGDNTSSNVAPAVAATNGAGTSSAIDPVLGQLLSALEGGGNHGGGGAQPALAPSAILPTDRGTAGSAPAMSTSEVLILGVIASLIAAAIWWFVIKKRNLKELSADIKKEV